MRAHFASTVWGLGIALSSGAALGIPPRPDHIVIVIEENKGDDEVIGSPGAPYINSLATGGAHFANMYALTHPSQPNYLQLFSGANQGVQTNAIPGGIPFSTPNLGATLLGAGITFSGYCEDLPEVGSTAPDFGVYARRHNPWVNWQSDVPGENQFLPSLNKPFFTAGKNPQPFFGEVNAPTDYSGLPVVSFVVPNLINDMHDGSIKEADMWLYDNIRPYAEWAMTHNSLLILTWDEDSNTSRNRIPTVFYGPMVRPGSYTAWWTLHDLLRMIEDLCGVAHSGAGNQARPMGGWDVGGPVLTTRVFTQGVNGYSGTHDTYIEENTPNTPRGASQLNVVDQSPRSQALIRFDDFVGSGSHQIPAGATIYAAKLVILTGRNSLLDDESTHVSKAHAMLTPWDESSTWNSLDQGISTDDLDAKKVPDYEVLPNVLDAWAIFDVTDTVQALVNGSAANWGWVLDPSDSDNWRYFSSEAGNLNDRPRLVVSFDLAACQPAISEQPQWQRADVGGFASFTANSAGADPIAYQWRKDGKPLVDGEGISGATTRWLLLGPVAETDGGVFDLLVSNPCGSVTSEAAGLLVCLVSATGDMNADGLVDGADIEQFSRGVIEATQDVSIICPGDFSSNGTLDASDIERFITILIGSER